MKSISHNNCIKIALIALFLLIVSACIPCSSYNAVADVVKPQSATENESSTNDSATEKESSTNNQETGSLYQPNMTLQESALLYNTAMLEQDRLNFEIKQYEDRISEIDAQLPELKALSEACMRAQYKQSSESMTVMSCLMNSESITDSLAMLEVYSWFYQYNVDSINKYVQLKKEKKSLQGKIEKDQIALEEAIKIANENLGNAIEARQEIQANALQRQNAESVTIDPVSSPAAAATKENVDWQVSSKQEFVDKWAVRIDKYLEGSPTAGCGVYYAQYAWDFGVDPRWAPAISNTESSKGAHCFRPYNAWGFGQYDFESWQQGIEKVVSTLSSSLYGSYLTKSAAATYCPPTWQDWYKNTSEQMALI